MNIQDLTEFFAWLSVINIAILIFSTAMILLLKKSMGGYHAKLFSIKEEEVFASYFEYLGNYKTLIIVFNLAPFITLMIMG